MHSVAFPDEASLIIMTLILIAREKQHATSCGKGIVLYSFIITVLTGGVLFHGEVPGSDTN